MSREKATSLAVKYRPKNFFDVVGQDKAVSTVVNFINSGNVPNAFIFFGNRGSGKTTVARLLSKSLNCGSKKDENPCGGCAVCLNIDSGTFMDVVEVDAATNTGVDNIRQLRENASYSTVSGGYKVYIIDEAHMLSKGAFNALLKIMEEPPPKVVFILVTTELDKIPITVKSRAQSIPFLPINCGTIEDLVKKVFNLETGQNFEVNIPSIIANVSDGSARDSLKYIELILASGSFDQESMLEAIGYSGLLSVPDLALAIVEQDPLSVLSCIDVCTTFSSDFKVLVRMLQKFFADCVVASSIGNYTLCNGNRGSIERCINIRDSSNKMFSFTRAFNSLLDLEEKIDKHNNRRVVEVGLLSISGTADG